MRGYVPVCICLSFQVCMCCVCVCATIAGTRITYVTSLTCDAEKGEEAPGGLGWAAWLEKPIGLFGKLQASKLM